MNDIKAKAVSGAFKKMGSKININPPTRLRLNPRVSGGHNIDVRSDEFVLRTGKSVDVTVLDVQPKDRHLLLMVKDAKTAKYLCGHDETQWFVAGVPESAKSVEHAMRLLQPEPVRQAIIDQRLKHNEQFMRRNKAFIRQGEWFFVPQPELQVKDILVLKNEPIRRGRARPHMVELVYRTGGIQVMPCRHYPNGLTQAQWDASLKHEQAGFVEPSRWDKKGHGDHCKIANRWMTRDAEVYAKGTVKHPDHATIKLVGWHRVYLSNEVVDERFMAFLD